MGVIYSTFRSLFVASPVPINTLMIGIDTAGKTTILYKLKLGEIVTTTPTLGFIVETITYNNFTFTVWDVCGGGQGPNLWQHYYSQCVTGFILVVDSNDRDRINQVKEHLWRMFQELDDAELPKMPFLVYANKQDLPSAMMVAEIRDALDLKAVQGREWHIQGASAMNGEGLKEGLDWYIAQVSKRATPHE